MRPTSASLALISLLLSCLGAFASADDRASSALPSELFLEWLASHEQAHGLGGNAVRYGLDPETGEWGYPGALAVPFLGVSEAWEDRSILVRNVDGSMTVYPDPRLFTDFSVVRIGPDGTLHWDCAPLPDALRMLGRPEGAAPER